MTREVPLTQGQLALVDDDDYLELSKNQWHAKKHGNTYYARRYISGVGGRRLCVYMHRAILGQPPNGLEVDHIDRNGLNNQRSNMRFVSHRENCHNKGVPRNNTSGVKGVSRFRGGKWRAEKRINGKWVWLGAYASKDEAKRAYEMAERQNFYIKGDCDR